MVGESRTPALSRRSTIPQFIKRLLTLNS